MPTVRQDPCSLGKRRPAVLVAGAGRFGSRALGELTKGRPRWRLIAVDKEAAALDPWAKLGVETHHGDAVKVLDAIMTQEPPRWIVAAVPFHLAHSWVMYRLSAHVGAVEVLAVPGDLPVPNPIRGAAGDLYSSFATFVCPEHCPEPHGRCFVTGEDRPVPLFRLLANLRPADYKVLGIRSYQLAPGVGGCRGDEMMRLYEAARASCGRVILYTACRCHGVLSGMRISARH